MPRQKPSYGQESILNLIPHAAPIRAKSDRYTSKHRNDVKASTKAAKTDQKTMGPLKIPCDPPSQYLKKKDRTFEVVKKPEGDRYNQPRKAPLPSSQAVIPGSTNKDFIKKNAIENITSIPNYPKHITCDTVNGNKNLMENSGLVPKFITKTEYGKVPNYIVAKKSYEAMRQEEYESYMAEVVRSKSLEQISDNEKEATVKSLKDRWASIHEEFQGLSVVTDTLSKKHRKERLEGELLKIETDLKVLERHDKIFLTKQILY